MQRFGYLDRGSRVFVVCLVSSRHLSIYKPLMFQPADPIIQVENIGDERIDTSTSSYTLLHIFSFTELPHALQPEIPMFLGQNDTKRHGASPPPVMGLNPFSTCT